MGELTTHEPRDDAEHDTSYEREELAWRQARESRICGPLGWRSVSGLHWLPAGEHRCGAGEGATIPLPARDGVPETALLISVGANGQVGIRAADGVEARYGERPFETLSLQASPQGVDAIYLPGFMVEIMRRGPGIGARVRDAASPGLGEPSPIRWFAPRAEWRVRAKLEPQTGATIPIMNVLGDEEEFPCPGQYVFSANGHTHRLTPFLETPESDTLFFVFRDRTNGKETYGAGRFLFAKVGPETVLDFNRSVSPPCAYTEFATCPTAPQCNWLDIRVDAGERAPVYRGDE